MNDARQRLQVLCSGILALLLFLGVARFSYTPLLPMMRAQAGLGIEAAGWLAAVNYLGYLLGVFLCGYIVNLQLKDRLYRAGMIVAVLSTVLMGLGEHEWLWLLSRFVAGLGTAAGMILGSGLIMNWLLRHRHRSELGIHFSGIGLAIALSSVVVMLFERVLDWRELWFLFSVLGVLLAIPAWRWLPRPEPDDGAAPAAHMQDRPPGTAFRRLLMASYCCAGFGYVVTATFIVAVIDDLPDMHGMGAGVFLVMGLAGAPACILWDLVARRVGEVNALICAAVLQVAGVMLPVAGLGAGAAMTGAVLFGGTSAGIVSLVMSMAGRYYPTRPAKMMSRMTVAYGLAQISAPAITGMLAGRGGSYVQGMYLAVAVLVVGTILLALLKLVEGRPAPMA